ncbi:MAG: metal ABC transporter permease [Planctomycetota bacterium]|nr:metal ABC transporter permease [Planctomycetota bacterium]
MEPPPPMMDWTLRTVLLTVSLLGAAAGAAGAFVLLRRRALLGDVMSHAALPGVAIAFIVTASLGLTRSLPALALGAALTALAGAWCVSWIRRQTRLRDDAAMGIVLGCFYGLGVALLGIVQSLPTGQQAGLTHLLLGHVASMTSSDLWSVLAGASVVLILTLALFKEWRLLCFDEPFAQAIGRPTRRLDAMLMVALGLVIVVGMQAAGLLVVVALLITPAAAARACTVRTGSMVAIASAIGALSGAGGALLSASAPDLPAGALCVLVACAAFLVALVVGPAEGVLWRALRRWRLEARVRREHLLRAMWELSSPCERPATTPAALLRRTPVALATLLQRRSWSGPRLRALIGREARRGYIQWTATRDVVTLTEAGSAQARSLERIHRLWEEYLTRRADIAPTHVDRDADIIEHVLGPELVQQLERDLDRRGGGATA